MRIIIVSVPPSVGNTLKIIMCTPPPGGPIHIIRCMLPCLFRRDGNMHNIIFNVPPSGEHIEHNTEQHIIIGIVPPPPRRSIYIIMCMLPVGGEYTSLFPKWSRGHAHYYCQCASLSGEHIEHNNVYPSGGHTQYKVYAPLSFSKGRQHAHYYFQCASLRGNTLKIILNNTLLLGLCLPRPGGAYTLECVCARCVGGVYTLIFPKCSRGACALVLSMCLPQRGSTLKIIMCTPSPGVGPYTL